VIHRFDGRHDERPLALLDLCGITHLDIYAWLHHVPRDYEITAVDDIPMLKYDEKYNGSAQTLVQSYNPPLIYWLYTRKQSRLRFQASAVVLIRFPALYPQVGVTLDDKNQYFIGDTFAMMRDVTFNGEERRSMSSLFCVMISPLL